jgi:hypothetical protein
MQMGTQDFLPLDETLGSLGPPADLTQVCVQAVLSGRLSIQVLGAIECPLLGYMVRSSLDQQMPQEGAGEQVALLLDISNKFLWADNPTRPVCT